MSGNEDNMQCDNMLKALSDQHKGDIPKLLGTIAAFLARKTDFFIGGKDGQWQKMLRGIFEEKAKQAEQEHEKRLAKKAEEEKKKLEAKQRKEEELKKESPALKEVTDEEAAKLQREINEEKNNENVAESKPKVELSQPLGDEANNERDRTKLKANEGRGCNLEKYRWTQTLEEVELEIPLTTVVQGRDITVKVLKKKLFVGIKGQPPIIDGELHRDVKNEETTWQLDEEGKTIEITLEKESDIFWWTQLMTTDPEIKLPRESEFNKHGYKTEKVKVPKPKRK